MTVKRILLFIVTSVVVFAAFAWAFRPQPISVDLAVIDRGDVLVTVADEGVTRIREVYTISAPVPGRVQRSPLEVGSLVTRHDTIVATIEPQAPAFLDMRVRGEAQAVARSAEASLRLAKAELTRAEAEEAYWLAELDRHERLRRTNTIAARTLEQTQLELSIRKAAVATAAAAISVREEELARARAALIEPDASTVDRRGDCCVTLKSPVSGRVLSIQAESEQVVATGAPLLTVGDPQDIEIVVDFLSSDAVKVERGAHAVIQRWGGENSLSARVERIEPAGFTKVSALGIEEQRVNVILELTTPRASWITLGHEFRVIAEVLVLKRDDVPRIPIAAIFRQGSSWATYVARDRRAELRMLTLGARNNTVAEVIEGLRAEEAVILHPSDQIMDGVSIAIRE